MIYTDSAGKGPVQMSVVIWLVSFLCPLLIPKAILNSFNTSIVPMVSTPITGAAPEFYWYKKSGRLRLIWKGCKGREYKAYFLIAKITTHKAIQNQRKPIHFPPCHLFSSYWDQDEY